MKEEKKILHVVDSLNKGSGVTSVVMNFFQKKSDNYQYDFLILFNNRPVNFENKVKQKGANIYKVQDQFNFSFLKFFKNTRKIAKEHSNKYDVIHIHTIQFSLFILLFFKKYNPSNTASIMEVTPVILNAHGNMLVGITNMVYNKIIKAVFLSFTSPKGSILYPPFL